MVIVDFILIFKFPANNAPLMPKEETTLPAVTKWPPPEASQEGSRTSET
jgi:hypothetical protein